VNPLRAASATASFVLSTFFRPQDSEAKTMIRELNGIVPVVELLKSEYAVIQSQALVALRLIAEDGIL
jgi:hypothetical protein